MTGNELTGFLIIGLIIVVADGQVLYRSGRRYLRGPDGDEGSGSMARMVVTVFHLVALGLLALLSVIGPGWSGSAAALVGRIGVFLLLLAVAHAATLSVLARRRQDTVVETHLHDRDQAELPAPRRAAADASWQPAVTPVPGQGGPHPQVSPDLGDHGPYRA
ncbi:hypothetical protein VA596_23270 [Amycolatopsis sp., V23-08]|uniref:Integral membrane protein n=1 Tax=Amycolatopsis heterodermiae TaxID=3110235 RepID=A0ABU5R8B2_9PSEU|nr:hypothetical protein [Amycolatopsis sp., V23-08]MEA5362477.1 hypothetical protein [Amycolatopsis sp., V23-08]